MSRESSLDSSERAQGARDNSNVLVVANPVSGGGRALEIASRVRDSAQPAMRALAADCLGGNPANWKLLETTADESWKLSLEAQVKSCGVRTLVVVGGDGTLMEVAALVYGWRMPDVAMVAVPGGRGNDFARSLHSYSSDCGDFLSWASSLIEERKLRWHKESIDLGSANGKLFLNMASLGYGGRVVRNAHGRKAIWSKTSLVYQVEGALALAGGGGHACDVKVDGESVYTGAFFGAFVGNGKANGGGLHWTRAARVDDGALDGIVFPKPGVFEMLKVMAAVRSKVAPLGSLPFRHREFRGSEITFHFESPTALELDGEFVGDSMSHGFICLPKALSVWVIKK